MRLRRSSAVNSRETRRWALATRFLMLMVASHTRAVLSCEAGDASAIRRPGHARDPLGVSADNDDLGAGFGRLDPDCSVPQPGRQPPTVC
jgi:hypothetical protein